MKMDKNVENKVIKEKIFRDPVHGYISINGTYVENLIDTFEMQRLKDVSQMGISPLFSNAIHDRFSHSLGVYHIGTKIYMSLKNSIKSILESEKLMNLQKYNGEKRGIKNRILKNLDCYEIYFHIACLLHDIGHPAYSHTYEYLYEMLLPLNKAPTSKKIRFSDELRKISDLIESDEAKTLYLSLRERVARLLYPEDAAKKSVSGKSHELMGAYQILTDKSLQLNIAKCIYSDYEDLEALKRKIRKKYFKDILQFIARMIIGEIYSIDAYTDNYALLNLSIRNCIIKLLNGEIDADSIDYLNRNAYISGYDSFHLDTDRLCSSFSAFLNPHEYDNNTYYTIESCFSKTALSALYGFIGARDFEPQWLYSHHKLVFYGDYLMKYLYKRCGNFIFEKALDNCKSKEAKNIRDATANFDVLADIAVEQNKHAHNRKAIRSIFLADILAPMYKTLANSYSFYKSTDSDLNVIFKSFYIQYCEKDYKDLTKWEKRALTSSLESTNIFDDGVRTNIETENEKEFKKFKLALKEFHTRKYRKSLWKSIYEYKLFIKEVKKCLIETSGLDEKNLYNMIKDDSIPAPDKISIEDCIDKLFVNIIKDSKSTEDFEDGFNFRNGQISENIVYVLPYAGGRGVEIFNNIFSLLGENLVIKFFELKFKDFSEIKVNFGDNKIEELKDLDYIKKINKYVPFIYYCEDDEDDVDGKTKGKTKEDLIQSIKNTFVDHIIEKYGLKKQKDGV